MISPAGMRSGAGDGASLATEVDAMKFAVNALIWTTEFDERSFALLPLIRQHGFDGFEVPVFEPAKVNARAVRGALAETGLQCTVCSILPAVSIQSAKTLRRDAEASNT